MPYFSLKHKRDVEYFGEVAKILAEGRKVSEEKEASYPYIGLGYCLVVSSHIVGRRNIS